jgi:alpha-D-xyloside xylohydrolase
MWLTAEGMRVEYAEDVYNIKETNRGLSLLCPTKHIRSRGDTLNLGTLTIVGCSNVESLSKLLNCS